MKWAYSLGGGDDEPIIKDEPVYDAAIIGTGELLQQGTTAFASGADAGFGLVNACSTTIATTIGLNAYGVSLQTITTSGNGAFYSLAAPQSVANALNATNGAGVGLRNTKSYAFSKVIINPLAVYRTMVSQSTSTTVDIIACAVAASSTNVQVAITGNGTASFAGYWLYFCGTAGPNYGSLRKIVSNASAATFVVDVAFSNAVTTADKVVIFSEMNTNPTYLSSNTVVASTGGSVGNLGTCISSGVTITASASAPCLNFRVIENYIEGGTYTGGITELRYNVQGQYSPAYNGTTPLVNKLSTVNFWQDLICLSHAFNTNSTAY